MTKFAQNLLAVKVSWHFATTPRISRKRHNNMLFKDKYRIESTRLKHWNYSEPGYYYVTICTKNRERWFGEVENKIMRLNEYGCIAKTQWKWLEKQYPYIEVDEYIIMPDHTHAIIYIGGYEWVSTGEGVLVNENMGSREETGRDLSLRGPQNQTKKQPSKIKSLSELVGAYKTTTSKQIRNAGLPEFTWQPRFYDRIIRTKQELNNVRRYIKNNALFY
jgi:putative transposase